MVGRHGGNIKEITEIHQINSENLIDFSANINPLGLSKRLKDSLLSNFESIIYYPDLRYKELTSEIASYHHLIEKDVFLGNGAADVIYAIATGLPTKNLLLLSPTFSEYEDAFAHNVTNIHYVDIEKNQFQVDIDELINCIQSNQIDTVCICNPNNPTGQLIKKSEMKKILTFCQLNSIYLIVDEAFMDFLPQEESLDTEILTYDKLVIIRSLTKIFAIPGLRLGYLLTNNQSILDELNKQAVPWRINCFAEVAGREALKEKEFIKETISYIQKEQVFLEKQLQRFEEIEFFKTSCNFIFFRYLGDEDLQEKLLVYGILIRDCSNYKGLTGHYYRIAIRTHDENVQLLKAFERYFDERNNS